MFQWGSLLVLTSLANGVFVSKTKKYTFSGRLAAKRIQQIIASNTRQPSLLFDYCLRVL